MQNAQVETAYYNIHNIINLRVTGKKLLISEIDSHIKMFRCKENDRSQDIIIEEYQEPDLIHDVVFDDYNFSKDMLWRNETNFLMSALELPHVYKIDRLRLPINLLIQLALLKKGYTFIHAAGVRFKGKSSILCAYPGVGKTTLISVLNELNGEIYGDDLVIFGHGKIMSYPQSFTIYPYHRKLFPKLTKRTRLDLSFGKLLLTFEKKLSNFGLFGKLFGLARSRYFPEYRTVSIEDLLLQPKFLIADKLDEVVMLERANVNNFQIKEEEKFNFLEQANSILWHEWHAYFHELLLYNSLVGEKNWLFGLMEKSLAIMADNHVGLAAKKILVPHNWNSEALAQKLRIKLSALDEIEANNFSDRLKG